MSEVKVDTISERTAAGGVTIDGVLVKDGVATFQTAAGSPLVFEGATADAFETTFAITDPTADRTITFPDADITLAAGDTSTPAWHVGISSNQGIADVTATKVALADIKFDTGFTWDAVNYKGIPGTAGKYLIGCFAHFNASAVIYSAYTYLYLNGAMVAFWGDNDPSATHGAKSLGGSTIIDLGATDYVEMFVYTDWSSGSLVLERNTATECCTFMYGMKVIGG